MTAVHFAIVTPGTIRIRVGQGLTNEEREFTMNIVMIDRVRNLRRTVGGRLVQTTADMDRVLAQRRHPVIEPLVADARGGAKGYIEIRTLRDAQLEQRGEGRAGEVDAEADIILAGIHDTCRRYARRLPNSPKGKASKRILRACFRRGLAAVTNIPYEDELVLVEYIHERLTTDLAADAALLGMAPAVEELGEIVPLYRDALSLQEKITAAQVAEAYEAMQVAYFRLAFAVVSMVENAEDRDALLAPIFDQDDRLGAIYAARRAGQTGLSDDIADPDAEADAALQAELDEAEAAREAEQAAGADEVRAEVEGGAPEADQPTVRPIERG